MGKRKKTNKLLVGGIILILTIISIFLFTSFSFDGADQDPLSISFIDDQSGANIPLDFCNSEESCYSYLSQQGMPGNFLQLNGYTILCQNEICYANKI